jgi:hypothetical protein
MPQPNDVRVRMLATVGPTVTDRQRYDAGSEWTMPIDRALELEALGEAEILGELDTAAPNDPDEE